MICVSANFSSYAFSLMSHANIYLATSATYYTLPSLFPLPFSTINNLPHFRKLFRLSFVYSSTIFLPSYSFSMLSSLYFFDCEQLLLCGKKCKTEAFDLSGCHLFTFKNLTFNAPFFLLFRRYTYTEASRLLTKFIPTTLGTPSMKRFFYASVL
jgi:hypothetical protein